MIKFDKNAPNLVHFFVQKKVFCKIRINVENREFYLFKNETTCETAGHYHEISKKEKRWFPCKRTILEYFLQI